MIERPTLLAAEAVKLRIKHYRSKRPCKECGSHLRVLDGWNTSMSACEGCEVSGGISPGKIKSGLNQHNVKAAESFRKNWGIPTVYGGLARN